MLTTLGAFMKICLPVMSDQGIDSSISGHFGSAPFFLFVDTETLQTKSIGNQDANHQHGMCKPLAMIGNEHYDAIVVGGIGAGALNKLHSAGKKVFKTEFTTVRETVEAVKSGKLLEFAVNSACTHHGESHGHDHAPHGAYGIKGFNK